MKKTGHFHKHQRKQYSRGSYKNPYFGSMTKDKKNKTVKNSITILLLIPVLIMAGITYLFSYPSFKINSVEITGRHTIEKKTLEEEIRSYMNQSTFVLFHRVNRFLFGKTHFIETLEKKYAFETINISQDHQTVHIDFIEKTPDFVWKTGKTMYLADEQGKIIQQQTEIQEGSPLPIIIDRTGSPATINQQVLQEAEITSILAFHKQLAILGIPFTQTEIDQKEGKWVGIKTETGYTVLFDPSLNTQDQALRLKTVLTETIKDASKLQYIDLRFGDHVYFK